MKRVYLNRGEKYIFLRLEKLPNLKYTRLDIFRQIEDCQTFYLRRLRELLFSLPDTKFKNSAAKFVPAKFVYY